MSDRERAYQMLGGLPDHKLGYVIAYMQGLIADEQEDDRFCASLVQTYQNSSDRGEFISLDDAAALCGVKLNEL